MQKRSCGGPFGGGGGRRVGGGGPVGGGGGRVDVNEELNLL